MRDMLRPTYDTCIRRGFILHAPSGPRRNSPAGGRSSGYPFADTTMPNSDSERRALDAIDDLIDALRIAHGAARRVENEMHGRVFDDADRMSHTIHDVRRFAEQLKHEVEHFLGRERYVTDLPRAAGRLTAG